MKKVMFLFIAICVITAPSFTYANIIYLTIQGNFSNISGCPDPFGVGSNSASAMITVTMDSNRAPISSWVNADLTSALYVFESMSLKLTGTNIDGVYNPIWGNSQIENYFTTSSVITDVFHAFLQFTLPDGHRYLLPIRLDLPKSFWDDNESPPITKFIIQDDLLYASSFGIFPLFNILQEDSFPGTLCYRLSNVTVDSKVVRHLLNTSWSQINPYTYLFDSDDDGVSEEYVVGCTAVAVGQLINYYFQKGYRLGWLEYMLQGVKVFPRFVRQGELIWDKEKMILFGYETKPNYVSSIKNIDSPGASDIREFLWYVALGLDSLFREGSSTGAGGLYPSELYRLLFFEDKLATLLVDRFRFSDEIEVTDSLKRIDLEKQYIKESLDAGNPVFVTMRDTKKSIGHAAIIDGYEIEDNNKFKVFINWGWGNINSTNDKPYDTDGPISIGKYNFNRFTIYKNTKPINYYYSVQ